MPVLFPRPQNGRIFLSDFFLSMGTYLLCMQVRMRPHMFLPLPLANPRFARLAGRTTLMRISARLIRLPNHSWTNQRHFA